MKVDMYVCGPINHLRLLWNDPKTNSLYPFTAGREGETFSKSVPPLGIKYLPQDPDPLYSHVELLRFYLL